MGKSVNRDVYFKTHIENQPTAKAYIEALSKSPYKAHRNAAIEIINNFGHLDKIEEAMEVKDATHQEELRH